MIKACAWFCFLKFSAKKQKNQIIGTFFYLHLKKISIIRQRFVLLRLNQIR